MTENKLAILSMPVDQGGCGWYRIRQPFMMVKSTTKHELHVVDIQKDDAMDVYEAMKVANVIIIRQGGEQGMRDIKTKYPEIKAKWVLDIDDNIELISPYSEHYGEYGIKEFFDENSQQWIWKNGKNFNAGKNAARVASLLKGMAEVDMVTTTTKYLKDYAEKYSNNVKVLPNCINLDNWWRLPLKKNKTIRVGWSGGVSHYEDFYSIKGPLNRLMKKYQFKLVMIGSHYAGLIDKENRDLIEVHPWLPFLGHSYRMMAMSLDIAVVPLADLPFNHFKSSIKFLEMSAMGTPSVVSNIKPYSEDVTEDNAMPYKTAKQFETGLRKLLTKPAIRKKVGYAARKFVEKKYDAEKEAKQWVEVYKSVLE